MGNKRVLIADDSRTIRVLGERALKSAGYEVFTASDGLQAVDLAAKIQPDLVILDIQMPIMDGYEVCDQILRLSNQASKPRIIFLTNQQGRQLERLGQIFGAYVQKPFQEQKLLDAVHRLIDAPDAAAPAALSDPADPGLVALENMVDRSAQPAAPTL